jgi:hypothetical protein
MRFQTPRAQILSASSEREVERVLYDAVGQVDPEELKTLPEDVLPVLGKLRGDVHDAAVTLLHCDLKHRGEEGVSDLLRQLAELYASASVRISRLRHSLPEN